MKNLITLSILFLLSIAAPAQSGSNGSFLNPLSRKQDQNKKYGEFSRRWSDWDLMRQSPETTGPSRKSSLDARQRLDSVVTEDYNDQSGMWSLSEKEDYQYDDKEDLVRFTVFESDTVNKVWVGSYREETAFDSGGNMTLLAYFSWNEFEDQWIPLYKYEYVYENGMKKYDRNFVWNGEENKWISNGLWTYEYAGKLLSSLTLTGKDTNYDGDINNLDHIRISYFYDPGGNLTSDITYKKDDDGTTWIRYTKSEYTYSPDLKLIAEVLYYWIEEPEGWEKSYQVEYTYDSGGNLTANISSWWDSDNSIWIPSYKQEFNFTTTGNLASMVFYSWDDATGSWIGDEKNEYTHNENYSFEDLIVPYFFPAEYFKNMITGFTQWVFNDGDWFQTARGRIYYSETSSSGVEASKAEEMKVFPNPASGLVNFSFNTVHQNTTVDFYDAFGRLVSSAVLPESGQVSVSHLSAGLYMFRLKAGGAVQTGRLMIK